MKNFIPIIMVFYLFQACNAQNKLNKGFIYHTAVYDSGKVYQERIYNSYSGEYQYREFSDEEETRNIKMNLKLSSEQMESLYKFYSSVNSRMTDCYYIDNQLVHKSTVAFNTEKDNFTQSNCTILQRNPKLTEFEITFERFITTTKSYKQLFYWEFYIK